MIKIWIILTLEEIKKFNYILEFQNQAIQMLIELYVIVLIQLQKILIRQDGNIY